MGKQDFVSDSNSKRAIGGVFLVQNEQKQVCPVSSPNRWVLTLQKKQYLLCCLPFFDSWIKTFLKSRYRAKSGDYVQAPCWSAFS